MRKVSVSALGVTYPSLMVACKELSLDYRRVREAMRRGSKFESLLHFKRLTPWEKVVLQFDGRSFETVVEMCRFYGLTTAAFYGRMLNGWPQVEALGIVPRVGRDVSGYVYKAVHKETGRAYIGITTVSVEWRWNGHLSAAASEKRSREGGLDGALRLYGEDAFTVDQIDTASTEGELQQKEKDYIAAHGTLWPSGFNLNKGGSGCSSIGLEARVGERDFPSIAAASRAFGKKPSEVYNKLRVGWSLDEVLIQGHKDGWKPRAPLIPMRIEGREFRSLSSAAQYVGIDRKTLEYRLNSGWTERQAFGFEAPPAKFRNLRMHTVDGETYLGDSAASRKIEMSLTTFKAHIDKGETAQEVAEWWRSERRLLIDGVFYPGISALERGVGITRSYFLKFKEGGKSDQEAVDLWREFVKNRRVHTVDGQDYTDDAAASRVIGISPTAFKVRLAKGQSAQEIADDWRASEFVVDGTTYRSINKMEKHVGISHHQFQKHHKDGRTEQEAVDAWRSETGRVAPRQCISSLATSCRTSRTACSLGNPHRLPLP